MSEIIDIKRKPTAVQEEALRRGTQQRNGIIALGDHNDRTQEGLARRGMGTWVSAADMGERGTHSWFVITDRGREYIAELDGAQQQAAEVIPTPVAEGLEPRLMDSPQQAGTHSHAYFNGAMVKVGVREDGTARRVHGLECRACGAVGTREVLEGRSCTPEREAEIKRLVAPQRQAPVSAPVAAPVRPEVPEVPEVPESAVPRSMADAVAFLGSLREGERVRVTRQGRTADLVVSRGARRADGLFGSVESMRVTVSYGVGRYSFEVSAGDLFAQRAGKMTTYGGVRMMRLPVEAERVFGIEVTTRVVSLRAESCEFEGEESHECTGECTWLDGDAREVEAPSTVTVEADADDLEVFGGPVGWALRYVLTKTDAVEPSVSPVGGEVPESAWLSGSYADPYEGDTRVREVSVRLVGDWTPAERARVFRGVKRG